MKPSEDPPRSHTQCLFVIKLRESLPVADIKMKKYSQRELRRNVVSYVAGTLRES